VASRISAVSNRQTFLKDNGLDRRPRLRLQEVGIIGLGPVTLEIPHGSSTGIHCGPRCESMYSSSPRTAARARTTSCLPLAAGGWYGARV
jgi:hypothetical protein